MSVALQCSRCGSPMHSSGLRGLCPRCLFACTTGRLDAAPEAGAAPEEQGFVAGTAVGPDGRFVLLDKLGQGGMGEVWLANDQALSQEGEPHFVALKFLSKSIRHEPRALAALRAEVLRSQQLSHPNIVRISDLHTTREGMPFIKMEFVEGNSLTKWLEDQPQPVMPWKMVTQVAEQIASALLYAHETVGIVHRDIKPSNLLLADGPVVKLSDFGIARVAHDRSRPADDAAALGTIWYSSPQQIMGQPPTPADDVYALGATLYELLTGTPPFEAATTEELIEKIQNEAPEPIPQRLANLGRQNEVPSKLLLFVQSCLEKDPVYRPKTRELTRYLPLIGVGGTPPRPIVAKPVQWRDAPTPAPPRSLAWVWVLMVALVAGAAWWQNWGDVQAKGPALFRTLLNKLHAAREGPTPIPPPHTPTTPTTETPVPTPTSSDSATPPTVTPQLTPPSAPTPPPSGCLAVNIRPDNPRLPHSLRIIDAQRNPVAEESLPPDALEFESRDLPAGAYRVLMVEGIGKDRLAMEEQVVIQPNRTNHLVFGFAKNAVLTVDSEPPGALVKWPLGASRIAAQTEARTPFNQGFESGTIAFTASAPGHYVLTTNYHFNPAVSRLLRLTLTRSPHPLRGEDWKNSLDLVFLWIKPLSNWACATETRVCDFRRFTEATGYDATHGMRSLTPAKGFAAVGGSWLEPGFPQTDENPVVGVSLEDANFFCAWLTQAEREQGRLAANQRYRLPSTNEWFVLAGDEPFPWGGDPKALAGNYSGLEVLGPDYPASWSSSVLSSHRDPFPRTAPVTCDHFLPNALGLHHVGGNAAEWCQEHVLCGASWADGERTDLNSLRTRTVRPADPRVRDSRNGFRMILCQDD